MSIDEVTKCLSNQSHLIAQANTRKDERKMRWKNGTQKDKRSTVFLDQSWILNKFESFVKRLHSHVAHIVNNFNLPCDNCDCKTVFFIHFLNVSLFLFYCCNGVCSHSRWSHPSPMSEQMNSELAFDWATKMRIEVLKIYTVNKSI